MRPITVRERIVSPPWIHEKLAGTREVSVGQESGLKPEPGPLALYRSVWPDHYVVWNVRRQLWEIRQLNPVTGQDERYQLVFRWGVRPNDTAPDGLLPDELEAGDIEVWRQSGIQHMVRLYRPFDYLFVWERLRQRQEMLDALAAHADSKDGLRRLGHQIARRNRQRSERRVREAAKELAAGYNEIRRWLPYISGAAAKKPAHLAGLTSE